MNSGKVGVPPNRGSGEVLNLGFDDGGRVRDGMVVWCVLYTLSLYWISIAISYCQHPLCTCPYTHTLSPDLILAVTAAFCFHSYLEW